MDIELHPNDWDDIHVKVSAMYYSIDDLVAVNGYLEEAESAINQHDVDNLINFSHTSKKSKLGELNSDLSTLMSYAETEPQYIADHYDKPFYDKIDEYVDDMQDLDVNSYEVKNNLGIKEIVHKQVAGPNGTETKNLLENKDKINLDDIFAGNNALSEMMQAEWKYYKKNGGKNITYADFLDGMLNSAAFNYKSQKDSQVKLENIISVALILGSFISGPVGMTCFTILLAADATSLSTGKNAFTGRKINDSEKWQLAAGLALSGFGQATKIFRGGKVIKERSAVEVEISSEKYPESARHIEDAINDGYPDTLTINRGGAKTNRSNSLRGIKKVPGKDLDEYPPAMFEEGGKGASVRAISPSDNRGSGASMGGLLKNYPDGTHVKIKVK